MAEASLEYCCNDTIPFHKSHWSTPSLISGLAFLVLWRATALFDVQGWSIIPWWVWAVLTGILPQVFLLIFPILTRSPIGKLDFPSLRQSLREIRVAILVIIASVAILALANVVLERFMPGKTLAPDAMKRMAESPQSPYVYLLLLFSFTFAPIAEEVFFRGFLQNALSHRMSWTLATATQCIIFGVGHFFGALHASVAVLLGLILTLVYRWRQTLLTPILIHSGINAAAAISVIITAAALTNGPALGVTGGPTDSKCIIRQVIPNSAAAQAGIQEGDVVIEFNRRPIENFAALRNSILHYRPGDTIPVTISRSGKRLELQVILQRRGEQ